MPLSGGEPSPYFEWEYKGLNSASDTGWRPAPLLLEHSNLAAGRLFCL